MKKILFLMCLMMLVLGCSTEEIKTIEDRETGDEIIFVRSKAPSDLEGEIETDKKTILTFVVGRNKSNGVNASKFIVTRVKTDSVSGAAFETKSDKTNHRKNHIIDTGYTIDLDEIRVSNGKDTFKKSNITKTEKEFHTLGVPTGVSFINYNLTDEEVILLCDIYSSEQVELSITDIEGKKYSGKVGVKDEVLKVLQMMKSSK